MDIEIFETKAELGRAAAGWAAQSIRQALERQGTARLILATGMSQFEVLNALLAAPGIAWEHISIFHLDEYIRLPETHPASFRKYLKERFTSRLPKLGVFHAVLGDAPDPQAECQRLGSLIRQAPVDVALIGIGENGHLAFNDPPADFDTDEAYLVVNLDEACRRQQVGEGWFASLQDVPRQAISMSIRQILRSRRIVCSVPDARKAAAVRGAVEGPLTSMLPASILRQHAECRLYLDRASAAGLSGSG